jgi:hypothetical protein
VKSGFSRDSTKYAFVPTNSRLSSVCVPSDRPTFVRELHAVSLSEHHVELEGRAGGDGEARDEQSKTRTKRDGRKPEASRSFGDDLVHRHERERFENELERCDRKCPTGEDSGGRARQRTELERRAGPHLRAGLAPVRARCARRSRFVGTGRRRGWRFGLHGWELESRRRRGFVRPRTRELVEVRRGIGGERNDDGCGVRDLRARRAFDATRRAHRRRAPIEHQPKAIAAPFHTRLGAQRPLEHGFRTADEPFDGREHLRLARAPVGRRPDEFEPLRRARFARGNGQSESEHDEESPSRPRPPRP